VNRRVVAVLVGGLALVSVSSCSTVRPNAAKVGDVDIRRDGFERDMQKLSGSTTASIDQVRTWLTDRIRFAAAQRAISDQRLTVTDDDRTKGEALAKSEWQSYDGLPADLKAFVREGFGAEMALVATLATPGGQTVKEALGGQDGELCITAIPATSEDDAKAAVAQLTSGTALADVVGPRVAGTQLEATHGAVLNTDGTCPPASQLNQTVNDALADVKMSTPSAPVQLSDTSGTAAWFVFVPTKAGNPDAKAIVTALKAAAVPVSVDSRYGHWDVETQTVVAGDTTDLG
jgi:hypothetical protein